MGEIANKIMDAHLQRGINTIEDTKYHLHDAAELMDLEGAGKIRDFLYKCDSMIDELKEMKSDKAKER